MRCRRRPLVDVPVMFGPGKGTRFREVPVSRGVVALVAGRYEAATRSALASGLRHSRVFYDIGAADGFFTRFALRLMDPGARVVAIEPSARARGGLEALASLADARGVKLTIRSEAVGATDGHARLASETGRAPRLSDFGEWIAVRALDSLVEKGGLPVPDLVKLDVEGGEVAALEGMANVLTKSHPALVIECHSVPLLHATLGILLKHRYGVRVSQGGDYVGPVIVSTCHAPSINRLCEGEIVHNAHCRDA
jgi:FkbM family methyltransferase